MTFTTQELQEHLEKLNLSTVEAAKMLSVTTRTIDRWLKNPHEISAPAEQALRAWLRLKQHNIPWRPRSHILGDDPNLPYIIANHRNHTIKLDQIIKNVSARGGASSPWQVDLQKGVAKLETIEVYFDKLRSGGFSPASYWRKDTHPDYARDQHLIKEAIYCIHVALSKEAKSHKS
ncbi:MAG: hypothetical protein Q8K36_05445 [Alphaproteobacteria bacterium]|nr:hypothetical protein [Alphaproteobacteria bacterium]